MVITVGPRGLHIGAAECSFTLGSCHPRVSGISMDVAVPEDTGQDPALEVERCACRLGTVVRPAR